MRIQIVVKRNGYKNTLRFKCMETKLVISEKLKFITDHKKHFLDQPVVIRKQLLALIKSLKKS